MKITGKEMVFRKGFDGKPSYSIGVSKKVNDKYESAFMNVSFRKGVSVANRTKIEIENAWLNWYEGKNGKVITMFIDQFNVLSDETNDIPTGFSVVDDDEIPFG